MIKKVPEVAFIWAGRLLADAATRTHGKGGQTGVGHGSLGKRINISDTGGPGALLHLQGNLGFASQSGTKLLAWDAWVGYSKATGKCYPLYVSIQTDAGSRTCFEYNGVDGQRVVLAPISEELLSINVRLPFVPPRPTM